MTKYLFSVIHDQPIEEYQASLADGEFEAIQTGVDAFNDRAMAAGVWVFAGGLTSSEHATTVDSTGASPVVSDGPFSESKEYIGGFWILEFPDLDEALTWAKDASAACQVPIEVRAFEGVVETEEA